MKAFRLMAVVLSSLLLAAHFLRQWDLVFVLLALSPIGVLLLERPWARRAAQAVLLLGAAEWVRTTVALLNERQALGAPWGRMVLILGTVTLVTLLSVLLLQGSPAGTRPGSKQLDAGRGLTGGTLS